MCSASYSRTTHIRMNSISCSIQREPLQPFCHRKGAHHVIRAEGSKGDMQLLHGEAVRICSVCWLALQSKQMWWVREAILPSGTGCLNGTFMFSLL